MTVTQGRIASVLLAAALAACTSEAGPMGPEGPQGEPGPGTRLVLKGYFVTSSVDVALPPEAGTIDDPPIVTVYMSPEEYRALRRSIGTQAEVAELLGVHRVTVADRERGAKPIDREAELALRYLVER